MVGTTLAASIPRGPSLWLGLGCSLCAASASFAWLPGTVWAGLLPSFRSLVFLPLLGSSFAAGALAVLCSRRCRDGESGPAADSRAVWAGVGAAAATGIAASVAGGGLTLPVAAALVACGLLPGVLLANLGAAFARSAPRWLAGSIAGALVLIWPAGYAVGRLVAKAPSAAELARVVADLAPRAEPPPRPAKPAGFDAAHAWVRVVARAERVDGVAGGSPFVFSHSEDRLAFARHSGGAHRLAVQHLRDPGGDREVVVPAPAVALAWSPDDERIVALDHRGAFSVWDLRKDALIPLPIPTVDPGDVAGIVWWQPEDVLVLVARRGEPQVLSLDTLRLSAAEGHEAWGKSEDAARAVVLRKPSLHDGPKVRYRMQDTGAGASLVVEDVAAQYSRFLLAGLPQPGEAFSNRDGSIVFLAEGGRLRVIYMGLRDAPTLRFAVTSRDDFPVGEATVAALKERAIECVIAPPIINPLNGKTVAGDVERAKGLARVIAADGKTATVWISEEREAITTGDVVTLPRNTRTTGALLSPTWFGVLEKADSSQDFPRREAENPPTPAATSPAERSPVRIPSPPPVPKTMPAKVAVVLPQPVPLPVKPAAPPAPPTFVSKVPPLPANASARQRVEHFIAMHHAKMCDGDLDGRSADYGAMVKVADKDMSRAQMRQRDETTWAQAARVVERVDGPISVTAQQNNRHHCEYGLLFEFDRRDGLKESGAALVDMDVLLTALGPKIVSKRILIYKSNPTRRK